MIDTKFSETFTDQYSELKDYHCRRQDHNSLKNLPPYSTNPVHDGVFKPEKKLTIVSTHLLPGIIKFGRGNLDTTTKPSTGAGLLRSQPR